MDAAEKFVEVSSLICEPARARMLWNLLDGRSYTASELALVAGVSPTAASNHLGKLLQAGLLRADSQGRHRYFSFSKPEVAYVVEAMANLANTAGKNNREPVQEHGGIKYCRTCYDHLAGYVGVSMTDAMLRSKIISSNGDAYLVTAKGWSWLEDFGISESMFSGSRRPLTRQCLDWSERRPHLAGHLGAALLESMIGRGWFRKTKFSRELVVTAKGKEGAYSRLKLLI